jgi:hypothetical protein
MMTPNRIARLIANALLLTLALLGAATAVYLIGALLGFWRLP